MSEKEVIPKVVPLPELSSYNDECRGCLCKGDDYTHLGKLFVRRTACGKSMGDVIIADPLMLNCPVCIEELLYRELNEDHTTPWGDITHK